MDNRTRSGHLEFYEVKPAIPKLMNLCRKVVNQYVSQKIVNELCLPNELKRYLKYEELKDHSSPKSNVNNFSKLNQTTNNSNQFQTTFAF